MGDSLIQWTQKTWNCLRGCSIVSPGCHACYAMAVAAFRLSNTGQPYHGFAEVTESGRPRWTGKVSLIPQKLRDPLRWRKPSKVFVNSMSDLFHESLPDKDIDAVHGIMAAADRHTFQVLTKRAERMRAWHQRFVDHATECGEATSRALGEGGWSSLSYGAGGAWPLPNLWLGVSVESNAYLNRLHYLAECRAAVRWCSFEPLLEEIRCPDSWLMGLDWIVIGGESGSNKRPAARPRPISLDAIARLAEQAQDLNVPVYVKQVGTVLARELRMRDWKHGGRFSEFPKRIKVRQWPEKRAA